MLKTILEPAGVVVPKTNFPNPPWNEEWFKAEPMKQQLKALKKAWPRPNYALFHAMGLGKSFTAINLAAGRVHVGLIDSLVVICPTSVKLVWPIEFMKWCPIPYIIHVHEAGGNYETVDFIQHNHNFKVLVIGIEALSQGKAHELLNMFIDRHRTMVVLDESSRIKNHKATRTKRCIAIGDKVRFKLIMTGTEITQGIHDLWSQYRFLHEKIIGHKSYFGFRATYCIMGGFRGKNIIGYMNVESLMGRLAPFTDSVTKVEAMPWLPPKIYEQRIVEPSEEQRRVMIDLKELLIAEHNGDQLEIETVLERLTRYQQIVGGNFPYEVEDGYRTKPFEHNPKLDALVELIEDLPHTEKVIIWTRFKPEIKAVVEALVPFGKSVQFHGGIDFDGRKAAVDNFQNGDARFFVSNPTVGGMGLTLTAATTAIYYSNTFSYQDRVQSEDRCHRKGTVNAVTYIDIVMNHPIDKLIIRTLKNKTSMAAYVKQALGERQ